MSRTSLNATQVVTEDDETANQEGRRALRKDYRELKDLVENDSYALAAIPSEEYNTCHDTINVLFQQVDNIREIGMKLTGLIINCYALNLKIEINYIFRLLFILLFFILSIGIDVATLSHLALAVKKQAHRLGDNSSSFNFATFVHHLKERYSVDSTADGRQNYQPFDWSKLGMDIGNVFILPPKLSTMMGTLDVEIKQKKKGERTKKSKEDLVAENLEEIENKKNKSAENGEEDDEAEATNGRSAKLVRTIEKKCSSSSSSSSSSVPTNTPMLDLLVDIDDPVQTVENFFDFSFLVKNKQVIVSDDKASNSSKKELQLTMEQHPDKIANEDKKQMVLRIDMKDLLKIQDITQKVKNGVKTELHRDDELYRAANAHEQADLLQKRTSNHVKDSSPSPKKLKLTNKH